MRDLNGMELQHAANQHSSLLVMMYNGADCTTSASLHAPLQALAAKHPWLAVARMDVSASGTPIVANMFNVKNSPEILRGNYWKHLQIQSALLLFVSFVSFVSFVLFRLFLSVGARERWTPGGSLQRVSQ